MNWKDITEEQARQWARSMRTRYRAAQLSPEQIADCESIPGWSWERQHGSDTYLTFADARAFVQSLGLKSVPEWQKYCKSGERPLDIPSNPHTAYKTSGWRNWYDWLGTEYASFAQAREFVRALKLKNIDEWHAYCKSKAKPSDIPATPERFYADKGWAGLKDWLGTGPSRVRKNTFCKSARPFNEARIFVRSLGLQSKHEWGPYALSSAKPADIPSAPSQRYAGKGWVSWGDWLGTKTVAPQLRIFMPFEKARAFVQSLHIKNVTDWWAYCKSGKKPDNVPSNPLVVYANKGWTRWSDWLGIADRYVRAGQTQRENNKAKATGA